MYIWLNESIGLSEEDLIQVAAQNGFRHRVSFTIDVDLTIHTSDTGAVKISTIVQTI
jgi:hypothetical protein